MAETDVDDQTIAPAPRRVSAGAKRSAASADAILSAAAAILEEQGFKAFTIEAVARRAGAGKPTIYRWWPDKTALLIEVYARQKTGILEGIDTGSLEEDLASLIIAMWRFWRTTSAGPAFRAIIAEAQSAPVAASQLKDFLARRAVNVETIVARAAARGELRDGVDMGLLVEMVFAFNWLRLLTGSLDDESAIRPAVRQMLTGVLPAPPAAK